MLLVNGKKLESLPKLEKAIEFELVGGYTFEDPNLTKPDGSKYIRKNKELKLPTVFVAFDKASNQNVEYRYAVRDIPFTDKGGNMQRKYTPDRIVFVGTKLVCQVNQPDLAEFLRRSPWFERPENSKPIFREVNRQQIAQSRIDEERIRTKAKSLLLDEDRALDEPTLRKVLAELGDNTPGYDFSIVKDLLLTIADKDPKKFLKAVGASEPGAEKKSPEREANEARLKELGKLLSDVNLAKGLHVTSDEKLIEKLKEAEARLEKSALKA